jgi:anthranilate synthase component 2
MNGKILVLDNYDSFTYNLVHLLATIGARRVDVVRNDKLTVQEAAAYERIILSPGPGLPSEAGIMPALVRELAAHTPILGVCLGHQCIGEVFGATLENLAEPVHGKATLTEICDSEEKLFTAVPRSVKTGRYHSWVVKREGLPSALVITAVDPQGRIMALRHRELNVRGVQFHPESVLTEHGETMLKNWLAL